jgi:F-type H+-transporting ATPase subunit alpha
MAPYVAAAMAEYFWQELDQDTIVIYDDLTSHAQVYREISLISGISPGRDSYPGDMFFAHSSLLERAGRIARNGKTLTSLPAVLVPGGDISTYLPTNVMSITDGQLIFDLELFRSGMRPAISTSLSVSRVGGRGQSKTHKRIASRLRKALATYYEANEFSHFGSELALESRGDIEIGKRVLDIMSQAPGESAGIVAQQVMLEVALSVDTNTRLDIEKLKNVAAKRAEQVEDDNSFKGTVQLTAQEAQIEVKR